MESTLAQLYLSFMEPSNSQIANQIGSQIMELYQNPNAFVELFAILSNPETVPIIVRKSASIGLKKVIQIHLQFLLTQNEGRECLNNLVHILSDQSDPSIYSNIISALNPVFENVGDQWTDLTQLISMLLGSSNQNHIKMGLYLMSEFLPYATNFMKQNMQMIEKFIYLAFDSNDQDILMHGISLFASILSEENIQTFANDFAIIFNKVLEIYHTFLINDIDSPHIVTNDISSIIKSDPLFVPAPEIYKALIQIAADPNIPVEKNHYPLFPLKKLIKLYGDELEQMIYPSIPIFLQISASQFEGFGYINADNSRIITPLISAMASSISNTEQFIASLLQNLCKSNDIPSSFASICALIGLVDSSCDQVECYVQQIIEYAFHKIKTLQDEMIIEACCYLFVDLVTLQSDAVIPYAQGICDFSFQLCHVQDEELVRESFGLIAQIFYDLDLESSFLISYIPILVQEYQNAAITIKPYVMNCISYAIKSCREDSEVFADALLPIVLQGSQEELESEIDNKVSCIEALGDLLTFVPEKCSNIYESAIKLILSASSNEYTALRAISLKCLINIIKFSEGNLPIDLSSAAVQVSLSSINQPIPEGEVSIEDDSAYTIEEIIADGFKLLRVLIKYHPLSCQQYLDTIKTIFTKFLTKSLPIIQSIAIRTASQFIIKFNPPTTDVYDKLFEIIINSSDESLVLSSFNAYSKILSYSSNQLAIPNFERFVKASILCLSHKLKFQEESLNYNKTVSKSMVNFFSSLLSEQFSAFPSDLFLQACVEIIPKVSDKEVFSILEILSYFILNGGNITAEIMQFGVLKLNLCDFHHGHEPILFIRALIIKHPEQISPALETILQYFMQKLTAPTNQSKYYWPTIVTVISSLLSLSLSPLFRNSLQPSQYINYVLEKLPMQEFYEGAQFIYETLVGFIRIYNNQMMKFLPDILRVFIQTLLLKKSTFKKLDLSDDVIQQMINSIKTILTIQTELQQQIPTIIQNDPQKLQRLQSLLS